MALGAIASFCLLRSAEGGGFDADSFIPVSIGGGGGAGKGERRVGGLRLRVRGQAVQRGFYVVVDLGGGIVLPVVIGGGGGWG